MSSSPGHASLTVAVCTIRPGTLSNTIHSILSQDYSEFELLVIDQSHGQDIARIIEDANDPRIRHVRDQGVGLSRARNLATALAKAPIVAFTDDDCTARPDWVRQLIAVFESEPELVMVSGTVIPASSVSKFETCPFVEMTDAVCRNPDSISASHCRQRPFQSSRCSPAHTVLHIPARKLEAGRYLVATQFGIKRQANNFAILLHGCSSPRHGLLRRGCDRKDAGCETSVSSLDKG